MILEIKRVQYSYNSSPVLRDINLRVGDGEILTRISHKLLK